MGRKKKSASAPLIGRPTQAQSADIEERLRQAAIDVFLDSGFEGAKMEAIARAAGITKRTLYARYSDKSVLFSDVVVWAAARYHAAEIPLEIKDWELAEGLMAIARYALQRALDPGVVRLNKLIIMESARITDFSTRTYSSAWSPRVKAVIDLLQVHQNAGRIAVKDIEMAAELFVAMVSQRPLWNALSNASRPLKMEEAHMQQAVELFLRGIRQTGSTSKTRNVAKAGALKQSRTNIAKRLRTARKKQPA
jgi:TetR/AcrR family transcriptional regulator, mexJK operon transcriptional repressor